MFPNQEKEGLSVFEIRFVFCSLENKHFLCSYAWEAGCVCACVRACVCKSFYLCVGKGGKAEREGREKGREQTGRERTF